HQQTYHIDNPRDLGGSPSLRSGNLCPFVAGEQEGSNEALVESEANHPEYQKDKRADHIAEGEDHAFASSWQPSEGHENAGGERHPEQRKRQEHLPAEPHELVVAIARHDRLHHGEHEEDETEFAQEPDDAGHQVDRPDVDRGSQPPRNRMVVIAHIRMTAIYSPSMKSR